MEELEKIVLHLIDREYAEVIDKTLSTAEKVVLLAREFRSSPYLAGGELDPCRLLPGQLQQ